jgi:hypothetical protein
LSREMQKWVFLWFTLGNIWFCFADEKSIQINLKESFSGVDSQARGKILLHPSHASQFRIEIEQREPDIALFQVFDS